MLLIKSITDNLFFQKMNFSYKFILFEYSCKKKKVKSITNIKDGFLKNKDINLLFLWWLIFMIITISYIIFGKVKWILQKFKEIIILKDFNYDGIYTSFFILIFI